MLSHRLKNQRQITNGYALFKQILENSLEEAHRDNFRNHLTDQ